MGRVIVAGGNTGMKVPTTGIQAGTLAVGSVVKLMEGGSAVEYLVVNQGKPSRSSLYDDSCDGTWLLRKDIHGNKIWNSTDKNVYESSSVDVWLNGDFLNSLGSVEQVAVKQVKIPYCVGNTSGIVRSGADGLSCKIFSLAGYEVGLTKEEDSSFPIDGAKLDYFESGRSTSANLKRKSYLNGTANLWWLRSAYIGNVSFVWSIASDGSYNYYSSRNSFGIRPALILHKTAQFDESTLLLKGAA